MFKKNIYLLYPAGYCGTYINWALHRSEQTMSATTVDNPINTNSNSLSELGGYGSAHRHIKSPSHQTFYHHLRWMLYNRPTDTRIYSLGVFDSDDYGTRAAFAMQFILRSDPECFFINLHHGNDLDTKKYGAINNLHKWPVSFVANKFWKQHHIDGTRDDTVIDLAVRNNLIEYWASEFPMNGPMNRNEVEINLNNGRAWFEIRHDRNPNEIKREEYLTPDSTDAWQNFCEFDIKDILQPNFVDHLEQAIAKSNTGTYDFSYVRKFHDTYVANQQSAQWFADIENFRRTGQCSKYLLHSNLTQAFVVEEVLPHVPKDVDWKTLTTLELVDRFYCY